MPQGEGVTCLASKSENLSAISPAGPTDHCRSYYPVMSDSTSCDLSDNSDDEGDTIDGGRLFNSFGANSRDTSQGSLPEVSVSHRKVSKWVTLDLDLSDSDASSDEELPVNPFTVVDYARKTDVSGLYDNVYKGSNSEGPGDMHPADLVDELQVSDSESRTTTPHSAVEDFLPLSEDKIGDSLQREENSSPVAMCGLDETLKDESDLDVDSEIPKCNQFGAAPLIDAYIAPTPLVISTFNEDSNDCDSDVLTSPVMHRSVVSLSPVPCKISSSGQSGNRPVVTPVERDLCVSDSDSDSDLEERFMLVDQENDDGVSDHTDVDHSLILHDTAQTIQSQDLSCGVISPVSPKPNQMDTAVSAECDSQVSFTSDIDAASSDIHSKDDVEMVEDGGSIITIDPSPLDPSDMNSVEAATSEYEVTSAALFGEASSCDSEDEDEDDDDDDDDDDDYDDLICDTPIADVTVAKSVPPSGPALTKRLNPLDGVTVDSRVPTSLSSTSVDIAVAEVTVTSSTPTEVSALPSSVDEHPSDLTVDKSTPLSMPVLTSVSEGNPTLPGSASASTSVKASTAAKAAASPMDIIISDDDDDDDDVIIVNSEQGNKRQDVSDDGDDDDLMIIFQRNGRSSEIRPRYSPFKKSVTNSSSKKSADIIDCDPVIDMLDDDSDDGLKLATSKAPVELSTDKERLSPSKFTTSDTSSSDQTKSRSRTWCSSPSSAVASLTQLCSDNFTVVPTAENSITHPNKTSTSSAGGQSSSIDEVLLAVNSILNHDSDRLKSTAVDDPCSRTLVTDTESLLNSLAASTATAIPGDLNLTAFSSRSDHSGVLPSHLQVSTPQMMPMPSKTLDTPPVPPASPPSCTTKSPRADATYTANLSDKRLLSMPYVLAGVSDGKRPSTSDDKTCVPLKKRCHSSNPDLSSTVPGAANVQHESSRPPDSSNLANPLGCGTPNKRPIAIPDKNHVTILYEMHRYLKPGSDAKRGVVAKQLPSISHKPVVSSSPPVVTSAAMTASSATNIVSSCSGSTVTSRPLTKYSKPPSRLESESRLPLLWSHSHTILPRSDNSVSSTTDQLSNLTNSLRRASKAFADYTARSAKGLKLASVARSSQRDESTRTVWMSQVPPWAAASAKYLTDSPPVVNRILPLPARSANDSVKSLQISSSHIQPSSVHSSTQTSNVPVSRPSTSPLSTRRGQPVKPIVISPVTSSSSSPTVIVTSPTQLSTLPKKTVIKNWLSTRRGQPVKPIAISPVTSSSSSPTVMVTSPTQLSTLPKKTAIMNWLTGQSSTFSGLQPPTLNAAYSNPVDLSIKMQPPTQDVTSVVDLSSTCNIHSPSSVSSVSKLSDYEVCADCKKDVLPEKISQCNMGHNCCWPCLQQRVKQILATSSTEMLLCPTSNCASSFSKTELQRLFPTMIVEILEEKMEQCVLNMIERENKNKKPPENPLLSSLPTEWTPMSESTGYRLVELSASSEEYLKLGLNFHSTMLYPRAAIKGIYRVQNPVLWQFYSVKKMQMQQENGGELVHEMQLYHGTRMWTIDPICKNNFDWRLSGLHGTFYGQGAYFARDAKYSHMYTDRGGQNVPSIVKYAMGPSPSVFLPKQSDLPPSNKSDTYNARISLLNAKYHSLLNLQSCNGAQQPSSKQQPMHALIVARVLVGKYTRGNASLRKPPPFSALDPHGRCYDSCVDNEINPNIYCIFDTAQTYPEYIIEYTNAPPNAPT